LVDILGVDILGVDVSEGRYIGGRCIGSRYIGGRFIVGRYIGGRSIEVVPFFSLNHLVTVATETGRIRRGRVGRKEHNSVVLVESSKDFSLPCLRNNFVHGINKPLNNW
jgi:hypothetical protein